MKSIILDVDGILWDITEVVAKAWNKAILEVGGAHAIMALAALKYDTESLS